jgi:transposase
VAGDPWGRPEHLGDESPPARARSHAQKKTLIAGEQDAAARATWQAEVAGLDPATLVFVDETSTPTTLTPHRGRSRRGTRVVGRVPRGKWQAVTLLATLTPTGLGPGLQLEGAIDRQSFDTFVTEVLVPTLRPGQTVILDNLSVHKSPQAQAAIEAVGCALRFLPAYSPDFNPIEQAFSKLKHLLRQAEARTVETILTATQDAYPRITAQDACGFYRDSGYNL